MRQKKDGKFLGLTGDRCVLFFALGLGETEKSIYERRRVLAFARLPKVGEQGSKWACKSRRMHCVDIMPRADGAEGKQFAEERDGITLHCGTLYLCTSSPSSCDFGLAKPSIDHHPHGFHELIFVFALPFCPSLFANWVSIFLSVDLKLFISCS